VNDIPAWLRREASAENNDGRFDAAARFREAADELDRLREFVGQLAKCPCCESKDRCADGCTCESDCERANCMELWDDMQAARWALKGGGA
jgi:hypothetical protein